MPPIEYVTLSICLIKRVHMNIRAIFIVIWGLLNQNEVKFNLDWLEGNQVDR